MLTYAAGQAPVPAHPSNGSPAPAAAPAPTTPAGTTPAPKAAVDPLPPGSAKGLVSDTCTGCHAIDRIVSRRMSREGWLGTVDDMISRGADISTDDETKIVDYLNANFGKPSGGAPAAKH